MPCFLGLAVSIHTPTGPLPEYSIQKQSKFHRINSYIPVPPSTTPPGGGKPEQSTFAISITLLTPGLHVPYSTPKATSEDPHPRPKIVGGLPGLGNERGKNGPVISPYKPLTTSPNETIAAYIYFDGRAKEEVATLLRRGEETWVNSRWVSVPESEGGGLAEREFLFREVGLERWVQGLDLEGTDVAARIERRKQRLEKKRRKRREARGSDDDDEKEKPSKTDVLRYGDNKDAPVESLSNNEDFFTSDSDSEDEPPQPEAAGQIKVALFRVLASGEIKRGEYSPQFDAHDDDEGTTEEGDNVDHTTTFAKPKTLDPKSISTQTVTGIDPPDKPYAVFTFLYRGPEKLVKMGILPPEHAPVTQQKNRRKSAGLNFGDLKPLNANSGTKNFGGYRDPTVQSPKAKKKGPDDMDSDADDDDDDKAKGGDADEDKEVNKDLLSPEDALRQGELAEGVRKIKLKRQHSAEPLNRSSSTPTAQGTSGSGSPISGAPISNIGTNAESSAAKSSVPSDMTTAGTVGSPFKKHRASLPGFDEGVRRSLGSALAGTKERGNSEGSIPAVTVETKMEDEDEL
ncbi:hypothetical protein BU24DRAFT_22273 [Aaosphaeria arxii CBS 175.79]|uniref:DUF7918 domain-containing protein n=1 Tax=Aaosphaeria arxii CBS 175.79 TaxID=1450172 RepID=A0A6A5YAC3_9PLEO|nr:uncharacterized protein BU24DRAFT_22273 [Aaosphaeria arxii CBS 175.79]KAF2021534.1 hypothetical protein BU24DRAFT_22273 [Aaosphaeria arxii CBS 175.79]